MTTIEKEGLAEISQKNTVTETTDLILNLALELRASDIHFSPTKSGLQVRFRIDGVLQDISLIPQNTQPEIISRIKILSRLRTDEHQNPQDGRFCFYNKDSPVNIRVSITPTHYGENAVLRLLSEHSEKLTLNNLGFSKQHQEIIDQSIRKTYGMILVTGPTGSGKTTTLYNILKKLNQKGISIITIEDPIEYAIDGINQIQVNAKTGLNFSNGLRSILRQDPDIIMVGEIRDKETARLAVNTALTGHLVLSTIHANDSPSTITRLFDLEIEPFLISSTTNIIIAQRLIRKICTSCKRQNFLNDNEVLSLEKMQMFSGINLRQVFYKGFGCNNCNQSGYKGRIGIYEIITVNEKIRESILSKHSSDQIKIIAKSEGLKTMLEDGLVKVQEGLTTFEELLRVIHE